MVKRILIAAFGVLSCLGCSSSTSGTQSDESLNCAWLHGDNCWKSTVVESASCVPPSTETGTLSADGTTCTYAGGQVVTFNKPLVLPLPTGTDVDWDFSVSSAGQQCLHFSSTGGSQLLTVGMDTVSEQPSGGLGLAVSCPDGSHVSTANGLSILACGLGDLPGYSWSSSDTSASLSLIGGASGQPIFSCAKATPTP
jgi:hypothetical protein